MIMFETFKPGRRVAERGESLPPQNRRAEKRIESKKVNESERK
jgi:hypothetical protein